MAAHWQQGSRGAKNLPEISLPHLQVQDTAAVAATSMKKKNNNKQTIRENFNKRMKNGWKDLPKIGEKSNAEKVNYKVTKEATTTLNNMSTQSVTLTNNQAGKVTKEPDKTIHGNPREPTSLSLGTWNVRTMRTDGHWDILLEEVKRFGLDILGLSETHLTGPETLLEKGEFTVLLSSRRDNICREGVGILVSRRILQCLVSYEAISPRIITAKLKMKEGMTNIIQVYAPTTAHSDEESDKFYDALQLHLQKIHKKENVILMGDFNAKVGSEHNIWAPALGKYGLGQINSRGEKLLEFCMVHKLGVCNTYFQHKECRRSTWTSPCGQYRNQIDYIITKLENIGIFHNCRSFCSADIGSDHNLVVANVKSLPNKFKRMRSLPKMYDVSRFRDLNIAEEFKAKIGGAFEPLLHLQDMDADGLWVKFRDTTNTMTEEAVGFKRPKAVMGLPEETRKACEQRRKARTLMLNNPSIKNKKLYKKLNKEVKFKVKKWKKKILDSEIIELEAAHAKNDSHELFKKVKKLAGERDKLQPAAKTKDGILKTAPHEVLDCWKQHFDAHLNTKFPRDENVLQDIPDPPQSISQSDPFTMEEAESAIKMLKNNKACGWDKIAAETLKAGGQKMSELLLKIINSALLEGKAPQDWSKGLITHVYKKGDKLNPANYRAITLLSVPGKVFCRMILNRIQQTIDNYLTEEQCGFRNSRGTTDAIFVVRQIMEKAKERRVSIHWNFVDFKAAFDTIWREALWKCLRSIGVDKALVDLIESMYNQSMCSVMVNGKITEWFDVRVGVRQGCLLSPSLFNLFLEFVMSDVQKLGSGVQMGNMHVNNIRYADDTTLMELMFEKLQLSTDTLERACRKWGMKINATKCQVMTEDQRDIKLQDTIIDKAKKFTFLGSVVPSVEEDVRRRISLAAWAFGRLKNTIWDNQNITRSLKVRIYKSLILPIALYGAETWTLRQADESRLQAFEMRCLRTIAGVHILDKIRNEDIRRRLQITSTIYEEVTKRRLRWFGHVCRMPKYRLPVQAYKNEFDKRRPPGRPPLRWRDQVQKDVGFPLQEAEDVAQGRADWRRITRRRAKGHPVLCP